MTASIDPKTELAAVRSQQANLAARRAELEKQLAPPPPLAAIDATLAEIDALPDSDPSKAEKRRFTLDMRRSMEQYLDANPPQAGGRASSHFTPEHIDKRLAILRDPASPKPGERARNSECRPTDEAEVAREIQYLVDLRARKFPNA